MESELILLADSNDKVIRIGTRQSPLARWQAEWVAGQLRGHAHQVDLVWITTQGDVAQQPLGQIGGQGLFTKEIQRALLDRTADVAVHSLKDLPTEVLPTLRLSAVPEREDVHDCLIGRTAETLEKLKPNARVGTGSLRRASQLRAWRPDLEIVDIRGNVDTRLRKLDEGQYDAIVLAAAGLERLQLTHRITEKLPLEKMLPAIGQAALGLETRSDDKESQAALGSIVHRDTFAAVCCERSILRALRAGCLAPVAAYARVEGDRLVVIARVLSVDGKRCVECEQSDLVDSAESLGEQVAGELLAQGAGELIGEARGRA